MPKPRRKPRIGAYLRKVREKQGISQDQLARAVGYKGPEGISRIECGQVSFPFEKASLFADALGLDPQQFWLFCMESADIEEPRPLEVQGRGRVPADIVGKLATVHRSQRFWEKVRELVKDDDERTALEAQLRKISRK